MEEAIFRLESDSIGTKEVPADAYYGVQSLRAVENFSMTGERLRPEMINSLAYIKKACAIANMKADNMKPETGNAIVEACDLILQGKYHDQFIVDPLQGGAGTSLNMNANEVIANRALEIMGKERGDYKFCSPNDHINCAQSTNDAYPTALHLTIVMMNKKVVESLKALVASFKAKAKEFDKIIKMGRTQLQDAVPMTLGQEFKAFADSLEEEIENLEYNKKKLYAINMGGTAIGTGINATPGFTKLCCKKLAELTGEPFVAAKNLVAATPDTAGYVAYHGALKRLAVKLSKVCNDLRLLASGPRCGLGEINLPPKAPGSSIMPGKVNPVIPEVTNQVCFKVIGNDTAVAFAAEAGQLQLNVMEPVIIQCITESITWMSNVMNTLRVECVDGITANADHCIDLVKNSIGIVTALNPYIGYKASTKIAKEAQQTGRSVYDIVLEQKVMTKAKLDEALSPKNMLAPRDYKK